MNGLLRHVAMSFYNSQYVNHTSIAITSKEILARELLMKNWDVPLSGLYPMQTPLEESSGI